MLERVVIQGFQSHTDTVLDFDSQSNVIKGDNGSGKSAIRRAILWVLTNKPTGTAFINWSYPDNVPCIVEITYNGHVVSRKRSRDSKVNEYVIDGEVLTAFGVQVPQPVLDIFKLDDTNIELQHSALFMLTESAPEMARRLNKLTNLEAIDTAFASIRRRKADTSKKIKDEQSRKADIEQEIEKYAWLGEAENIATKLELCVELIDELFDDLGDINALISDLSIVIARIKPYAEVSAKEVETVLSDFQKISTEYQTVDSLYQTIQNLKINAHAPFTPTSITTLRDSLVKEAAEVAAIRQSIADMEKLQIRKTPPISSREVNVDTIKNIMNEYLDVMKVLDNLRTIETNISHTKTVYGNMKEEYGRVMPPVCPLCGAFTHEGECV